MNHNVPFSTHKIFYFVQVYNDPVEFTNVDQIAISVAQEDQKSFTDLVRQLVGRCGSDIEKAR